MANYTAEELAAMLGKALKETETYAALEKAQEAYENSENLHKTMMEYNVQQQAYNVESQKDPADTLLLASIERRVEELYNLIISDPVFVALNTAQEEFNALMEQINGTLMYNLTGQMPCSHDCSSCGGGCSHQH